MAVVVLVVAGVVLVLLWQWIDKLALSDPERKAAAHLVAVKVASAFVVGGGGVFALYLVVRRQRTREQELATRQAELANTERVAENSRLLAEQTAAATEHDAVQRRVTELYTAAAAQRGSDKAPVRLAGLYALERLAQDNPSQRQTIVNVLCTYLRMPFTPPQEEAPGPDDGEKVLLDYRERVQEREVRRTAQRLLTDHLRPGHDQDILATTFWARIDLDLTGATLVDWNLNECHVHNATFNRARFIGGARFDRARFIGAAGFVGAEFFGGARFDKARFIGNARFDKARFTGGDAWFDKARFIGEAVFGGAQFIGEAVFGGAQFSSGAWFDKAQFTGDTWFDKAQFAGDARFDGARFERQMPSEIAAWSDPVTRDDAGSGSAEPTK